VGAGVIVVSVGFNWERVWRGIAAIGLEPGGCLLLYNSLPRHPKAQRAVERVSRLARLSFPGARVRARWLDPSTPFEENVAVIRRSAEEALERPGLPVWFLASGGLRWLSLAVAAAASAFRTLAPIRGAGPVGLRVDLEEEAEGATLGVPGGSVVLEPPPIAVVDADDVALLEAIRRLGGAAKATRLAGATGWPRAKVYRRLASLAERGLVRREPRGRGAAYRLSPLGVMLS
jgi:CRISPR locus-related DNA-binding protein